MWLLFLLPFVAAVIGTPVIGGNDVGYIINRDGRQVLKNPATYPFIVFLEFSHKLYISQHYTEEKVMLCGGTLVGRDVVLTAAHCLTTLTKNWVVVAKAGIVHRTVAERYKLAKGVDHLIHQNYVWKEGKKFQKNDIGLIWLDKKFPLNREVKLAELPENYQSYEKTDALIAGWGQNDNGEFPEMLREGKVKVISNKKCKRAFPEQDVTENMICVISPKKTTIQCTGDSGGPLVVNGTVIGITSWGKKKVLHLANGATRKICDPTFPGVFTRVDKYKKWIDFNIKLGSPKQRQNAFKQEVHSPGRYEVIDKSVVEERGFLRRCDRRKKKGNACTIL